MSRLTGIAGRRTRTSFPLVVVFLGGALAACDDDGNGPGGTDETPVITAIAPSTIVGGDSIRISGRDFGSNASELTVSVIGDTTPITALPVQSVADTAIAAQVPIILAGALQATVAVGGRTSDPATLIVIPSSGGIYAAEASVLANPCAVEPDLVADYAEHLSDVSWRVTQVGRPATGALTIATADGVTWEGDVGPVAAGPFRASTAIGVEDFIGDLEVIVAPARFVGTLTLHSPGTLDCAVVLALDARRTSEPILESRSPSSARPPASPDG